MGIPNSPIKPEQKGPPTSKTTRKKESPVTYNVTLAHNVTCHNLNSRNTPVNSPNGYRKALENISKNSLGIRTRGYRSNT